MPDLEVQSRGCGGGDAAAEGPVAAWGMAGRIMRSPFKKGKDLKENRNAGSPCRPCMSIISS